jgi:hypothetical protein
MLDAGYWMLEDEVGWLRFLIVIVESFGDLDLDSCFYNTMIHSKNNIIKST